MYVQRILLQASEKNRQETAGWKRLVREEVEEKKKKHMIYYILRDKSPQREPTVKSTQETEQRGKRLER